MNSFDDVSVGSLTVRGSSSSDDLTFSGVSGLSTALGAAVAPWAPVNHVLVVGDSVAEGYYADGNPGTAAGRERYGFPYLLQQALQRRDGDGGPGFYGLWKSQWAIAGGDGGWARLSGYSPYGDLYYSHAAPDFTKKLVLSGVSGSSAELLWVAGDTGCSLVVEVDGVAQTVVLSAASGTLDTYRSAAFDLGSSGEHTISISQPVSGTARLIGVSVYSGSPGVVVHNVAKEANSLIGMLADENALSYIDALKPRLTIISHGLVDYLDQTVLETFGTVLAAVITRAKKWGDVVVVMPLCGGTEEEITYAEYVAQAKTTAATFTGVPVISMADQWGTYAANAARMADTLHPNALGHSDMAGAIYNRVKALV